MHKGWVSNRLNRHANDAAQLLRVLLQERLERRAHQLRAGRVASGGSVSDEDRAGDEHAGSADAQLEEATVACPAAEPFAQGRVESCCVEA